MSTWFEKNFRILHRQNFLIMVVLIIFRAMWECKIPYFLAELKFVHSEKAIKFCKISTLDLSSVVPVKSTVEISQNFVAFLEYMNFNNWNWSLEKKCIEMRVFFAKRRKKVILFISVWPVYTYWEKIAKEKSLFMYNRLKFAAKEANLCIHKSKHQKKGENLPAARPKARYFVPKIIMINCEKDLFLWSKKKKIESGLKFVWDT